jgi:hypothetical protein
MSGAPWCRAPARRTPCTPRACRSSSPRSSRLRSPDQRWPSRPAPSGLLAGDDVGDAPLATRRVLNETRAETRRGLYEPGRTRPARGLPGVCPTSGWPPPSRHFAPRNGGPTTSSSTARQGRHTSSSSFEYAIKEPRALGGRVDRGGPQGLARGEPRTARKRPPAAGRAAIWPGCAQGPAGAAPRGVACDPRGVGEVVRKAFADDLSAHWVAVQELSLETVVHGKIL